MCPASFVQRYPVQRCVHAIVQVGPSNPEPSLGLRLRAIAAGAHKSCDADAGGCGRQLPVRVALPAAPPRCFVLQLAWASAEERGADIGATLAALQEVPDLARPPSSSNSCVPSHACMPGCLRRSCSGICQKRA
jgi:hypothetical protein